MNKVKISIDGQEISAAAGSNLLAVALSNNIKIPNLCYHKHLSPTGACRLCVVKIDGVPGLTPSCAAVITDNMKVIAFDDELEQTRKDILTMILASHNDDCINCVRDGSCELQDLAFRYNISRSERQYQPTWQKLTAAADDSAPILTYDATKCVMCERCVKGCREQQGKGVLSFAARGIKTHVIAGQHDWGNSTCDGCGQCVQNCPTAALSNKPWLGRTRQKDIENRTVTTCPYCGVGCQLEVATIGNKIVQVTGADETPNFTRTCVKGRYGLDFVNRPERLVKPLIKKNGQLVESEWEEALDLVAAKFKQIKQQHGSDAFMGLASAKVTNEENFIFQKFMRAVIGTNNVDHCARLCHASTVAGLAASFGSGAMTNTIAELEKAQIILVTGSNTTETHPVIATYIKRAIKCNNAKLIVIEPRKIDLVNYATIWLQPKNGTDVAWVNGFLNIIIESNLADKQFIQERTEGFAELQKLAVKYTPSYVENITGIPAVGLIAAAKLYASSKNSSIIYSMGITQHSHGTDNVKSLANLAMLTGNIGHENCGVNPLRGQNNVQGSCDMGALPDVYSGYQKVTDQASQKKFEHAWQTKLPETPGLKLTEMFDQVLAGKIKALYFMGENPMLADVNISHVKHALEAAEFLVCQDIFRTETTEFADVVLPAASFAEKDGTFTNTERRVLPVRKIIDPVGEAKPDWWIIQELAKRLGYSMNYADANAIMLEINTLTPSYAGITPKRIAAGEKLQWPCPTIDHPGTRFLHKEKFTKGLGTFFAIEYRPSEELPDQEYPFTLSTGRILYHYHTATMSRKTEVLTQYSDQAFAEINLQDAKQLGVTNGDMIKVTTRRGTIKLLAAITPKVAEKNIFIPFHFAEAAANLLTNDALDPVAKIPEYKVCACKIEKA